ncbi:MAG: hypothetical protein QNJ63_22885 [Calothrix sp. MO_192.B10]|nr:hypothetical protein [Calothrix sp. MO_192.B10]
MVLNLEALSILGKLATYTYIYQSNVVENILVPQEKAKNPLMLSIT